MILPHDAEMKQATDTPPFSNGFEGESWMAYWCHNCKNSVDGEGCTLVGVAMLGKTPFAWESLVRNGLSSRYICHEYAGQPDQ